jgi:hypothetical protein
MQRKTFGGLIMIMALWMTGCTHMVAVQSTEAYSVADCTYVGTFEEVKNPGQLSFGTLEHYLDTTAVEFRVKRRARATGATHLVWLYHHSEAAGALAYHYLAGDPPDGESIREGRP